MMTLGETFSPHTHDCGASHSKGSTTNSSSYCFILRRYRTTRRHWASVILLRICSDVYFSIFPGFHNSLCTTHKTTRRQQMRLPVLFAVGVRCMDVLFKELLALLILLLLPHVLWGQHTNMHTAYKAAVEEGGSLGLQALVALLLPLALAVLVESSRHARSRPEAPC